MIEGGRRRGEGKTERERERERELNGNIERKKERERERDRVRKTDRGEWRGFEIINLWRTVQGTFVELFFRV